ncbi:hypothetical protein QQZ08_000300 [Neonectria magnoliae]|uniref:Major facilitator superfamily (MFS) profile domain-containing protein n=1 Tax=Neonectria magnoliae TaxID=2732573 RepID=A0ABR1IJW1_9HYPO
MVKYSCEPSETTEQHGQKHLLNSKRFCFIGHLAIFTTTGDDMKKDVGDELRLETLDGADLDIPDRANILNYLDRNNIATARLGNFEQDIGLVDEQYNTIISIFFVGYILTSWYTKKELAVRISVLYAAGQMAGAFGGLLGSAIMAGMDGKAGLANWRWLFIIEGCATYPAAAVTYFVVPDYPSTTKWLSDEERKIAVLRMAEDASKEDDRAETSAAEGAKMVFTDPALYMIWLMQLGLNTAAAFTNFFPTIVKTLGYSSTITLLLSAPPYVFAAMLGITNSWHSDRVNERWLHVVWPQIFASIGFIISAVTLNTAARYVSTFIMMSVYGSFGCILSWVSSSLPRPSTKRAISYAVVNADSNLASIYASYFYPSSQGPRYWQANVASVAFAGLCIAMATVLRFFLGRRNKKLARARDVDIREECTMNGSRVKPLAQRWQCGSEYIYTL